MKAVAENPTAPPLMRSNLALKKQTEKQHIAFVVRAFFLAFARVMKQKHSCVFFVVSTFSFLLLAQPRVSARRPPQLSVFGRQGTWCPRPVRVEDFLFLPLIFHERAITRGQST